MEEETKTITEVPVMEMEVTEKNLEITADHVQVLLLLCYKMHPNFSIYQFQN